MIYTPNIAKIFTVEIPTLLHNIFTLLPISTPENDGKRECMNNEAMKLLPNLLDNRSVAYAHVANGIFAGGFESHVTHCCSNAHKIIAFAW